MKSGVFFASVLATATSASQVCNDCYKHDLSRNFLDPPLEYRSKFRYWMPDASVSLSSVQNDVQNVSAIGASGFEFLPFYFYGLVNGGPRPTNWSETGYGTPLYQNVFETSLRAHKDTGSSMDFALGVNQGQGVPSVPGVPGLAVQLMSGSVSLAAGEIYDDFVPAPTIDPALASGSGFQFPLESFGTPNLTAVLALEITSATNTSTGFTYHVNEATITDLTSVAKNGQLTWMAPQGSGNSTWQVMSFWEHYTNQRSSKGGINATTAIQNGSWVIDHFSAAGPKLVIDFLEKNILSTPEIRSLVKEVGRYVWEDSMEFLATLWWTPGFLEKFEQSRGYSLVPFLPLLYVASNQWSGEQLGRLDEYVYGNYTSDGTSLHNLDYRVVLDEGYQEYIKCYSDWAQTLNMGYSNQPAYNLPLDMLSDIPLVDVPETESLGFSDNVDTYRQFSGPAHLAGKQVISSELGAVNVVSYSQTIPDLLWHIKRSWAGGITRMVIHGSPYSGDYANTTWPGLNGFGYRYTEMWNRIQPCWQHMKDSMDYIARNQYVLQQGAAKIDLAFYMYEDPYLYDTHYQSSNLENMGYTYEYLNQANLASQFANFAQSVLAPNTSGYKALIFSNQTTISSAAATQMFNLAKEGLPIFYVGQMPNQTLSALESESVRTMAMISQTLELTNVRRVDSASDLPTALSNAKIQPRVFSDCSSDPLYTQWRSDTENGVEYVYIYNDQQIAASCSVTFDTFKTAQPSVLDAWTGSKQPLLWFYRPSITQIATSLTFAANETKIISFDTEAQHQGATAMNASASVIHLGFSNGTNAVATITGPGYITTDEGKTIRFNHSLPASTDLRYWDIEIEDWHGPSNPDRAFSVETEITTHRLYNRTLQSWSSFGEELKNVSGVARYSTTFTTPQPTNCNDGYAALGAYITLPRVEHTARLTLNGQPLPPIDPTNPRVDISDHLRSNGINVLQVEITTTLLNRIIADADKIMLVGFPVSILQPLYNTTPRSEYGLSGPVQVVWTEMIDVELDV